MKKLVLVFIIFNLFLENSSFSANKVNIEAFHKDIGWFTHPEKMDYFYKMKPNDAIRYEGKEWIVISNQEQDWEGQGARLIKITRRFPQHTSFLNREILIIKVSKALNKFERRSGSEKTLLGKILIGALVLGIGGAYLTSRFAPDYFNYLVEKATSPWLQDTFKVGLEKLGLSQSK